MPIVRAVSLVFLDEFEVCYQIQFYSIVPTFGMISHNKARHEIELGCGMRINSVLTNEEWTVQTCQPVKLKILEIPFF